MREEIIHGSGDWNDVLEEGERGHQPRPMQGATRH